MRAGLPESVAMMISESDLRLAGQKREVYLETENGYRTVTIEGFQEKRG